MEAKRPVPGSPGGFLANLILIKMNNFHSIIQEGNPLILTSPEQIQQLIEDALRAKFETEKQRFAENDLMDVSQAANFLGISKKTLYEKTAKRKIPFHKPAGTKKLWFSRERLTEWIKEQEG